MPGFLLHMEGLGGGVEVITPKSAMALKTDVHLSVIYSTRPVSADKVNLVVRPPFWLGIVLLATSGSKSGLDDAVCPRMHHGSQPAVHLHHVLVCVWVKKQGETFARVRAEVRNCQAQKATNFCT